MKTYKELKEELQEELRIIEELEKLEKEFDSLETEKGVKIVFTNDAEITRNYADPHGENYYTATAVDAEGYEYEVNWYILDGYDPEDGDEYKACDWDSPDEIIKSKDADYWD